MKKILIIDDAEFSLESTSTLLKFEGYDVQTASDGPAGIDLALKFKPDLILCDISMPGMTGYEVLENLRKNVKTATVPFIFLTALNEKVNMRVGMEKGADDYIVKPFTRDELLNGIDAQWKKHHLIEQHVQTRVNEVGKNVTYALPHEFRTALNEVIGNAKYLGQTADSIDKDEIKEISSDIVTSANRLLKITENFLTYVRVESFAINPEKRRQLRTFYTEEPIALVKDLTNVIAARYNRKNDLEIIGTDNGIIIEISSESFCKIINEIIDNSFRFSNVGEKVVITLTKKDNYLFFEVADHGRGMSVSQINTVAVLTQFERKIYEQQGVGLGLIISKRLVEIHDGAFELDSIIDEGTTITFSLPIQK